jgi:hypothetical protein
VAGLEQVLLTTTDLETVPAPARDTAHLLTVRAGAIGQQDTTL